MDTIGITGGTGFVGSHIAPLLLSKGYKVVIFTRHPEGKKSRGNIEYSYWDPSQNKCDLHSLKTLDAIVHLSGTNVSQRWTPTIKREIVSSRVHDTRFLVQQLKREAPRCKTFIAASAIGYYGADQPGDQPFMETDVAANDFLGSTCEAWEHESLAAADKIRTVILRFGLVMGKESGVFPSFSKPTSFGIVPILGSGNQIMSWIHVDDLARMLMQGISDGEMAGIYNAVTTNPVSQKEVMKTIAAVKGGVKIPVPVPEFALKLALGEMSVEVLKSATVSGAKILDTGFQFQYPEIEQAIRAILKS